MESSIKLHTITSAINDIHERGSQLGYLLNIEGFNILLDCGIREGSYFDDLLLYKE